MNLLEELFHGVRVWIGLADPAEARPTPPHGWLLPAPAEARRQRAELEALRAVRRHGPGK
jgi:hypothetical protein